MLTVFFAVATFVFCTASIILAFLLRRKILELRRLLMEGENKNFDMAEASIGLLGENEELEKQKEKMAEANLVLFEQREKLEEQGFKLAEANIRMLEQNEIIERERQRSEKLLLNILPSRIAEELKETGKTSPETFQNVTVFFSDIVGFTKMAASVEPSELIGELNEVFTAFDQISTKNGCERIKTIGDAYLCVCGMPVQCENHALNIAKSALEILEYLCSRN